MFISKLKLVASKMKKTSIRFEWTCDQRAMICWRQQHKIKINLYAGKNRTTLTISTWIDDIIDNWAI